ncbi:MAG: GAF domain-containing protein [Actinomycetota bacterium]|nr:GAF domain-containing protein [Actinomycetota bacterium]
MASGDTVAERIEAAEADLATRESVPDILGALCRHLIDVLGGSACAVSRIVGDMLVQLVEQTRPDVNWKQLGHGYLIADFPLTQEVLESGEPRTVSVDEHDADEAEVRLLRELSFEQLLMFPVTVEGRGWALVEVYGSAEAEFGEEHTRAAIAVAAAAGAAIERAGTG